MWSDLATDAAAQSAQVAEGGQSSVPSSISHAGLAAGLMLVERIVVQAVLVPFVVPRDLNGFGLLWTHPSRRTDPGHQL